MANYRCRGPRYSAEELEAVAKELGEIPERIEKLEKDVAEKKKAFDAARESGADDAQRKQAARNLTSARASLLMEQRRQSRLQSVDSRARKGCGYPLDELIDAMPQDGSEQLVDCPACGNVVSLRRVPVA